MSYPGILAVWNDRDELIGADYEGWYLEQHLPQRVALPGWRFGRRYEAVGFDAHGAHGTAPRFFAYYETDNPADCFSDVYLERLNNPTPETVQTMRHWRAMTRSVCELRLSTCLSNSAT